ncbi:hypothetical protein PP629_gp20 [Streptomyces phage Dubu]|uniref:Uncharacterized protein n=1 Tax=Streptomyces phage Dubu TaxID=2591226 RepID=A0A514DEV3_9CAUD|nr:hypothetical protein PP629_gp20 [Streptomyces phage Dubu]QDH92125.1 hypothetical protein SEA_DUBU_20 [Streptomyces phage Dubu]
MENLKKIRAWAAAHKRITVAVGALALALVAEYLPGVPVEPLTALAHALLGL